MIACRRNRSLLLATSILLIAAVQLIGQVAYALNPYSLLSKAEEQFAIDQSNSIEDAEIIDGHPMYEWLCFDAKLFSGASCDYSDFPDEVDGGYSYELSFEIRPNRSNRTCYYFFEKFKTRSECHGFRSEIHKLLSDSPPFCIYTTYMWWVRPDRQCHNIATWLLRKIKTAKEELLMPQLTAPAASTALPDSTSP